jgi:anti-sigma B factor antagonist
VADLELESRSSADGESVVVRGEIDMATAPKLRDTLNTLVDAGATRIVLDCRGLDFLDSSGSGVLIAVRKRLGDDGALTLESPPAHVRKVLELTGVSAHVEIVP